MSPLLQSSKKQFTNISLLQSRALPDLLRRNSLNFLLRLRNLMDLHRSIIPHVVIPVHSLLNHPLHRYPISDDLMFRFSGGAFFGQVLETYGILYVAIPCTILVTLCVALLSLCTEYYQIFLTQGVGFGIGAAGLFTCAVISTGQWFQKRRALALGIVAAGSSTGGVIHPIYLRILISSLGFPSAVRWSSLILGIATTLSCVLMRTRLPRKKWDRNAPFFDVTLFKQPIFSLYCLGSFFVT